MRTSASASPRGCSIGRTIWVTHGRRVTVGRRCGLSRRQSRGGLPGLALPGGAPTCRPGKVQRLTHVWLQLGGRLPLRWRHVRGMVYRPAVSPAAQAPVIVMAHQFGCVRALRLPALRRAFASAGYVVVVFDYRYFGDSGGSPRQLLDVAAQLDDWRAAIAWARPGRRGTRTSRRVGHLAVRRPRHHLAGTGAPLAAIIAQVPHLNWAPPPSVPPASARPHVCCPPPSGTPCGPCSTARRATWIRWVGRDRARSWW